MMRRSKGTCWDQETVVGVAGDAVAFPRAVHRRRGLHHGGQGAGFPLFDLFWPLVRQIIVAGADCNYPHGSTMMRERERVRQRGRVRKKGRVRVGRAGGSEVTARVSCWSSVVGCMGACLVREERRQKEREENEMVRWWLLDGGFKKISNLQIGPKSSF